MSDDPGTGATALGAPKPGEGGPVDFIRAIVDEDLAAGRHHGRVATRFPPEPNGYLHIGHAKSICLNFGIAQERGGICNLRFDDTNPAKEDVEYVDAIKEDVAWLGFTWDAELYASDYFERLYQFAVELIKQGKAYVDSLSADEIRAYRGTLTEPGKNSPYRDRSVAENLDLFARMRAGRVPRRRARAAREDRHGVAELQHARPDALPDPPRQPPSDRRRLVHLPDVRLRPSAVGRDGGDHALDLHPRVRGSSPALRLARRQRDRGRQAASIRVRAPQPELHGDEQAQAAAARAAGARLGVERSADADHQRSAAARVHAGIDPRLLRAHRRREEGKRHRHGAARAQRARGPEHPRAARDDGAAAAEGRADELPGGAGRRGRRHQQPGGRVRRHAQGAVLARALHRARRLHGGPAEEVLPPLARQGSAAALRLLHHLHRRS